VERFSIVLLSYDKFYYYVNVLPQITSATYRDMYKLLTPPLSYFPSLSYWNPMIHHRHRKTMHYMLLQTSNVLTVFKYFLFDT
jgi:hypothetical protein